MEKMGRQMIPASCVTTYHLLIKVPEPHNNHLLPTQTEIKLPTT